MLDVVSIYAFAFFTGIGMYSFIVPGFLRRCSLAVFLIPGLGLLQLTLASAYIIAASLPIRDALYVTVASAVVTTLLALLFSRRNAIVNDLPARGEWLTAIGKSAALLFLLAAVLSPMLRAGMPTTPYRIGIDQVGYAETAQYLVEGGTIAKARSTLLQQLATTDIVKAKLQNIRDLNFGTYVDAEFLLKAFRWGYPGAVAALTILTGSVHVYRLEFLLVAFSYALLVMLAYRVLRDYFRMGVPVAMGIAAAVGLNCNLLNVYFEGELTQVFMLPYFTLMLVVFLQLRMLAKTGGMKSVVLHDVRSILLFTFLVACFFAGYNEALVLFAGFVVTVSVVDMVVPRKVLIPPIVCVLAAYAAAFLVTYPLSHQWITYTIANLHNLSNAGFWQPHWGSLAEILGVFNMYYHTAFVRDAYSYVLYARSTIDEIVNILVSVAIAIVFVVFLRKERRLDAAFWATPLVLVAGAYCKMHYLDHMLNYPYMKVYTMLEPLIVCGVFAGLYILARRSRFRTVASYAALIVLLSVFVSGGIYIAQYDSDGAYVTADMFALYRYTDNHRRFSNIAMLAPRLAPSISDFMLTPLVSLNLVNENDGEKVVAPMLNAPVDVIVATSDLQCRECFVRTAGRHITYLNPSYVVYDTGRRLRDICVRESPRYTLAKLPLHDTDDWPYLPIPQCDYALGLGLVTNANALAPKPPHAK